MKKEKQPNWKSALSDSKRSPDDRNRTHFLIILVEDIWKKAYYWETVEERHWRREKEGTEISGRTEG